MDTVPASCLAGTPLYLHSWFSEPEGSCSSRCLYALKNSLHCCFFLGNKHANSLGCRHPTACNSENVETVWETQESGMSCSGWGNNCRGFFLIEFMRIGKILRKLCIVLLRRWLLRGVWSLVRGGGWPLGRACCSSGFGFEWQGHVTAVQGVIFGVWVSASRQKSQQVSVRCAWGGSESGRHGCVSFSTLEHGLLLQQRSKQ